MGLVVHIDGGARGNPGPAGAGVTIAPDDGQPLFEAGFYLGEQTNNAAEYHALLRALQRLQQYDTDRIEVRSDSELLVKQITGEYRVRNEKLGQLFEQAQLVLLKLPRWSIRHVGRDQNKRADELANMAMDAEADVIVRDVDRGADVEPLAEIAPPKAAGPDVPRTTRTPPEPDAAREARPGPERLVEVSLARPPREGGCPADGTFAEYLQVGNVVPGGLCAYAAHSILNTVLAIKNADSGEFFAIPTLTVRCSRPECGAEFHVCPAGRGNGRAPDPQ